MVPITIVFMGFINQLSYLGGPTLCKWVGFQWPCVLCAAKNDGGPTDYISERRERLGAVFLWDFNGMLTLRCHLTWLGNLYK